MLRKALVYLVYFAILSSARAQENPDGLVKWLTFKEAQEKNKQQQKPLLVDFYTDWCGWCKHMMRTTYSNPGLANYINTNFYPVKFNAETKDTIEYNGKVYKPLSKEPKTPHELTLKFLGNSLSYPSTAFVTNNYEYTLLTQGYLEDKKIEPILVFMVENAWRTSVYDEFSKHFNHTFYDTTYTKGVVKTVSVTELEKLQKKKPKKVLVSVGAGFCNTCRVMNRTTFSDTTVAAYINKNYYVVNFDVETNDTIVFKKTKYYKTLYNNFPLHGLAVKFTNNRFSMPALCVLDENLETIDVLNFYQSPEQIKPALEYFASNSYKTKTWSDFIKEYTQPKAQASHK